ncbi:MAG: hypothetical protein ACRCUS_05125 [Anaerovoracaceae bacterium]
MAHLAGIKTITDAKGKARYLQIDLKKYGNSELLEDFLDRLIIEATKDEPTTAWEDIKKRLDTKHGIK